jgi:2-desacetyl-2-hydroxyethyl bacteriochlorophyllide A dehydrogenase
MRGHGVVFTEKLKVAYLEVDIPEPERDEVVIDVEFSWISIGTESSFLRCDRIAGETPYREGDKMPFPQINGYQKVGVITAVGADVTGLQAGDRVFATMSRVNGMAFPSGGHISPAITHVSQVWKLPDGADPIDYSGLVLVQVGYNCGMRLAIEEGQLAVVIGDGLVGQWAAHTLLHRGAKVAVIGRHDDRLSLLPDAIGRINARRTNAAQELADAGGISVVVDTVGSLATVMELKPLMKHNSHLVSAGFLGTDGLIDIQELRAQEITLHCPSGWEKKRMDASLQGIAEGWLHTKQLITHRFPVEQAAEAWALILDKNRPCLGVVLDWKKG